MARRRLENAIQAGKFIGQGKDLPAKFTQVTEENKCFYPEDRDGVYSLQYSYDGTVLAVGYGDGGVEILSSATGKHQKDIKKRKPGGLAVTCLRFNPQEQHVCFTGSSEGKVHACSIIDGTSQEIISEPGNEINCLDFCLDGNTFATAGKDLDIRLYDTETQKLTKVYEGYSYVSPEQAIAGHAQRIFALRFHPESNAVFITGGWDDHLKVWDARTKDGVLRTIHGPHVCGDSLDIKGHKVLTGSWVAHNALQLWDFTEGMLLRNIPVPHSGQGEFLYCAQFCDNNMVLAGGSGTDGVHALSTNTTQLLGSVELDHPIQALDSTHGGRLFAVGGGGYKLKLASMS